MFQSTHLHEVWHPVFRPASQYWLFQSTHLHEVWRLHKDSIEDIESFNPHTYMRCDFDVRAEYPNFLRFNPHTYMRCDPFEFLLFLTLKVSIHTPTWGVTTGKSVKHWCVTVSIHTPTWGVTVNKDYYERLLKVSIHTPTWGVTCRDDRSPKKLPVSIHTPTWGVTVQPTNHCQTIMFQSTHLHEVWHRKWINRYKHICFNPHTYMRCD